MEKNLQINSKFSKWVKWSQRNELSNLNYPGVYIIAYTKKDLTKSKTVWIKEIIYVGMTNSKGGLKSRLRQFENTIKGKNEHGGAQRVRYKHKNYDNFIKNAYVSVKFFECTPASNNFKDILIMGDVAKFEYDCLANYVKKFNQLPEFNDKKKSLKKQIFYYGKKFHSH